MPIRDLQILSPSGWDGEMRLTSFTRALTDALRRRNGVRDIRAFTTLSMGKLSPTRALLAFIDPRVVEKPNQTPPRLFEVEHVDEYHPARQLAKAHALRRETAAQARQAENDARHERYKAEQLEKERAEADMLLTAIRPAPPV